jgi:hypothetical protein
LSAFHTAAQRSGVGGQAQGKQAGNENLNIEAFVIALGR